ncbi:uncharacterized protein LOC111712825 [Eurytemora carolleeae]|uniref:uncharacterized protein LOC111712825 n=1 Tax=Eurytemora carolleeae TaxID=1294199 RepID=UPI000C75851C|nr:uncharacterized protein LOC111712825 [Eurytemora carolleeae]|eukprot:XP_023343331.1 uncharacterized protein LOC111712825 [Eurytemora affinis]
MKMKMKRQLKKCVPRLGVKFIGLPDSWVNRALKPAVIGLKQISNFHRKLYEKDGAKLKQAENSQRPRTVIKYSEQTSNLPSRNIKLDSTKNEQTEENRSPEKHQIFHMPTLIWDQKEKPVRVPVKAPIPRFIKPVIKKKKIKKKKPLLSLEERSMTPCQRIGFWWKRIITSSENDLKNRREKRKLVDYSGIYNILQEDSPISDLVLDSEDSWLRPNPTVVLPAQSVRQTT